MAGWSGGRFGARKTAGMRRPPTGHRPRTVGDVYAAVVRLRAEIRYEARRVIVRQRPLLLEMQRDQMYAGLDSTGHYIRPYYSQDPWFKSPESAARYAAWKASLRQRRPASYLPERPAEVPNLIINGNLIYNRLQVLVSLRAVRFELPGFDIERKYGQVLGFSPLVLRQYRRNLFWPVFYKTCRNLIESYTK